MRPHTPWRTPPLVCHCACSVRRSAASVAFAPSGGQLAASSDDGTVHLWDVSPGAAESQLCANLGQPLTRAKWNVYVPGDRTARRARSGHGCQHRWLDLLYPDGYAGRGGDLADVPGV